MITVYVNKLDPSFELPSYATSLSACFDLRFQAKTNTIINGVNSHNVPIELNLEHSRFTDQPYRVYLNPGDRLLIPTGLVFRIIPDFPVDIVGNKLQVDPDTERYSIRLHPRSSLAYKRGLTLANCEGVIDLDYQEQVFVPIMNTSNLIQRVELNERVCQGELVRCPKVRFFEVKDKLQPFSERDGGFGSTGKF